MSAISNLYSAFESFVSGQLSTYKRLPNGYNVEANSELLLAKGWALAIGPGTVTRSANGCQHATSRDIVVNITNTASSTDHDLTGHKSQELAILEDAYKLRKAIETDSDLAATVAKAIYTGDSGIEILEGDRFRFYRIAVTFNVEYFEAN